MTSPLSPTVRLPFLRTWVVLVQGVAAVPNDRAEMAPVAWVVVLVVTVPETDPTVHVSEIPALRASVVPGLIVASMVPVYSVPAGDVRTGAAEALPANAISDAAATTSRPIILRCFISFSLAPAPRGAGFYFS